ncbi:MAG: hypothetical protein CBB68_04585 [Rhodospirillaceae bacterium TMED8]|nr:hypothetical protein [Magnetovibrio sp.]OUT51610.1 MAG: hypothetical protein CBB68_04585 [Rhodospirillaceae bacterium TMED8]
MLITFERDHLPWHRAFISRLRRMLPERQIHFRTDGKVSYWRLTTLKQSLALVAIALTGSWMVYSSYSYVEHDRILSSREGQIANARLAYHSLLGEVSEYQNKFTEITKDLERNHAMMLGLVERNAKLQTSLRSVSEELVLTQDDRANIDNAREALGLKLSQVKSEIRDMTSHNFNLKDKLDTIESNLQTVIAERNHARFEGSRMKIHVNELETRLTALQQTHKSSVKRLSKQASVQIDSLEQIITKTGINPEKLANNYNGSVKGQGGPFIPVGDTDNLPAGELKRGLDNLDQQLAHLNTLQTAVRYLPLMPPLNSYYITSGFGKRRDPVNKRWAAHYGLDFGSTNRAKIYATAPGVVKQAGWKGRYGRFVEIDHGHGVRTRYGHMSKIFVKRGQKVKYREKIGLLGNTGRTTGSHLHYETLFNKRHLDPLKFIKAGRYVFQE